MTEPYQASVQGLTAIGLRSEAVEIAILPGLGGKVSSLRNRRSGREWMWTPPQGAVYGPVQPGDPFHLSSLVGADECLPTIAPCEFLGRTLPDHGEIWATAMEVDRVAFALGSLVTRTQLSCLPLWFERRISLEQNVVTFAYALRALEPMPQPFMWAFHPLLAIEPGDRIFLPAHVRSVIVAGATHPELGKRGDRRPWPLPLPGVALDRLDLGGGDAFAKLFTESREVAWAEVSNELSGDRLRFEFDPGEVDTLGIWINRGAWSGYHHLALEPGIGAPDDLTSAVQEWQRYGMAQPGETLHWQFRVVVG